MGAPGDLRKRYWSYVFGWVICIYSTLYMVRPLCTYLKETTPFSLLVNILIIVLLIPLIMGIWIKGRPIKLSTYFILVLVLAAYTYGLVTISYPEEKIHFIEYGFLAYLVYKAIENDVQKPAAYGYAFLLTTMFGWIDEGIQYLLPNRYYQNEDVILNSISGALGLLLVFIFRKEHKDKVCNY